MNKLLLFFLIIATITFTSCGEDEDPIDETYDASIAIMSPADGAVVTVDTIAHIHIDFTRPDSKTIHKVKVEVLDANGDVINTLIDDHVHEAGTYSFQSNDFTPTAHGAYTLRATTTNDEGLQPVMLERAFTAMHGASNTDYLVNIEILKPSSSTYNVSDNLNVEVKYTHHHGDVIHNILIDVIDDQMNTVATIVDQHAHNTMGMYTFQKTAAWSPTAAGIYRLRAMTTDMMGENMNMVMKELTVQ